MKYKVDWDYINSNKWCKDPWYNKTNGFYKKHSTILNIIPPIPLKILHFTKFINSLGKEESDFKKNYINLYSKALKANSKVEFWDILNLDPKKLMKFGSMWHYLEINIYSDKNSKKSYHRLISRKQNITNTTNNRYYLSLVQRSGINYNWYYNKIKNIPNKFIRETYKRSIFPNFIKLIIIEMNPDTQKKYELFNYTKEVNNTFIALTLSFHLNLLPLKPVYSIDELKNN